MSTCKDLLPPHVVENIDRDIEKYGYLDINKLRNEILKNLGCSNETGELIIEANAIVYIDSYVNYNIFIIGDNAYTEDELRAIYSLDKLNVKLETICEQQEVGKFGNEFIARDVSSNFNGWTIYDMLKIQSDPTYIPAEPQAVAKSKIYIAKEKWKNFTVMHSCIKAVSQNMLTQGENAVSPFLALL